MYYPCSENKGADQLRGYREADLRLCFRLCRLLLFPWGGSFIVHSLDSVLQCHHIFIKFDTFYSDTGDMSTVRPCAQWGPT